MHVDKGEILKSAKINVQVLTAVNRKKILRISNLTAQFLDRPDQYADTFQGVSLKVYGSNWVQPTDIGMHLFMKVIVPNLQTRGTYEQNTSVHAQS